MLSAPSQTALLGSIGAAAGLATLTGGLLALALRQRIHLILGFSAGAIVAVALLELLPEAFRTGASDYAPEVLAGFVALGFLLYLVVDRLLQIWAGEDRRAQGHFGAGSLTLHSLLDGVGVGLAFQASSAIGLIVAGAVLVHDVADGINTVNLSLVGADRRAAHRWLIADAAAPLIGIVVASLVHIPTVILAPALAGFTGAFLYIGAAKLISESHRRHPHLWTTLASTLGFAVIFVAVAIYHG